MNKHKNTHATPKSAPARASRTAARRAREGRRAVLLVGEARSGEFLTILSVILNL